MSRTWQKKAVRIVTVMMLLPLLFTVWLIATESGLRLVYHYATDYIPGDLKVEKLEGSLVGPLIASNFYYKLNGFEIKTNKIILEWLPAGLLTSNINVSKLHVEVLNIKLPASEKSTNDQPITLPDINLPWRVAVKDVVIAGIKIIKAERELVGLKQVTLNASSLFNKLTIKSLGINAEQFALNLKGQVNLNRTYQHKLEINWRTQFFTKAQLTGNGRVEGDLTAIKIQQQLNGLIKASVKADVYEVLNNINWQAEAFILDINSAEVHPDWPGHFKGKITSAGKIDNKQLLAHLTVSELSGKLRDYPLVFNSQLDWQNARLNISRFDLRSGKAMLNASGLIDSSIKLNWQFDSNNIAELSPEAKGQLQAKGQLSGSLSKPHLNARFNAKALSIADYAVATMNGEVDIELFSWQKINATINAQSLKIKERFIKSVDITADNHTIKANVISDIASALLHINGEITTKGAIGRIDKAELISSRYSDWKLKSPVNFKISEQQYLFDPLCWISINGNICTTVRHVNNVWQSQLEINKLPLALLSLWLPPDIEPEGFVNATAEFKLHELNTLEGFAHITLPPGAISYPLLQGEKGRWKYTGGKIDLTLDASGLIANSEISISNTEYFNGKLNLPKFKPLNIDTKKQPIEVNAQLNITDLGLVEALIPEVNSVKGEAGLNFKVLGTLAQPQIKGSAHLNKGAITIPRLGLNIRQITLSAKSNNFEKLEFELAAHSGEGKIAVKGNTVLSNQLGWPTIISIKGANFEVAHIPVSQLTVSPDLKVDIQNHKINVTGLVHIPFAKLQPKDVSTAARVSEDTVIIGNDIPVNNKWLIHTKVRLTLSERVNFYGFGFEGRFTGGLLLEDEPGQLTKATGEINIPEGRYAAYGQRLEVEHGRLLFSGGPATNPGLDLRAVRYIGTVTAGLKVSGTLNYPKIDLFSIPAMGQTDILSYVLLGRPIENATGDDGKMMAKAALALSLVGGDTLARKIGDRFGLDEMRVESSSNGDQASLVMGRYLSPKLYVGYGVGLIESFNTFNVRYQISDKWQIKGESGESHGADLLYTIER